MKELPLFKRLGSLPDVQVSVRERQIYVDANAKLQRSDDWYRIRATFSKVVYLRTISDHATFFLNDENGLHYFVEYHTSTLLHSIHTTPRGWTTIVTDIGSKTIAGPHQQPPKLRHFVLGSTSVSLEWLCEGVDVQVERDPSLDE